MYSDRRVKVCFVVSSLVNSGPVNALFNIVKYIDKSQFEIQIVTLFEELNSSRRESFEKLEVTIWESEHIKKKPFGVYFYLRSLLKKLNPDIVHSHCFYSLQYLSHIGGSFKKIHTLHGHPTDFYVIKYGRMIGRVMIASSFRAYRKMDQVVTCANHFETAIEKKAGKTVAIRNGVDTSVFRSVSSEEKVVLKREAGYENKVIYFMNNRLSPEKNNAFVLSNFPKEGNAHLIIVGDGKVEEKAILKSQQKSNISWVKYTDNVLQYLQISDYYISASKSEGLPMAVLEAMSCGVSPILSDIPSHREIVSSIKNAQMFSLDSKEELRSIFENTSNLKIQCSSQFRTHVKESFSAKNMANLHGEMYRKLITMN